VSPHQASLHVLTVPFSDTISSHEKKRHYLECIEQYIQYLHEQFELLGEPAPEMERVAVASYSGLNSRSIRVSEEILFVCLLLEENPNPQSDLKRTLIDARCL
jgi:hypothetical protein